MTIEERKQEVAKTQEQINKWGEKLEAARTQYALWIHANERAQTDLYFAQCDARKAGA